MSKEQAIEKTKAKFEKGQRLARDKYGDYLSAVETSYKREKGKKLPMNMEAYLGTAFENTKRWVEGQLRQRGAVATEAITQSDLGTFIEHGFELISAMIPTSIADEIASIQPMDREIGKVFWLDYIYGSSTGPVSAGDKVFDAKAGSNVYKYYSSEKVTEEAVGSSGSTNYTGTLADFPIRPNTVRFIDESGDQLITDDGEGNLTGDIGTGNNTINYTTGEYDVTFTSSTTSDVVVGYYYDLDQEPGNTKRLKLGIRSDTIEAKKRQLVSQWLLDAQFEMEQYFGENISSVLESALAGEVRAEKDQMIVDMMYDAASSSTAGGFDATAITYVTENDRNQDFQNYIIADSSQIEQQTGRMTGKFILAGKKVSDLIEGIPAFNGNDLSQREIAGPHYRGEIYGKRVYKIPSWDADSGRDNEYVIGHKGSNFVDAAFVNAPFLPLMISEPYMTSNMVMERGLMSRSGNYVTNSGGFVKNSVTFE